MINMANRQYTNYLSNLHNSNLTYHPNSITRLINSIVYSDDNTTNPDLIDFRTKLIEIIINNTKEFGLDFLLDDYFKLRNSLVIIKESIIKDNKDSLIELLSDKNKLEEYISKLDSIYQFNSRYERVKIDDKYERRKKEIKIYDLPTYIKEYEEKVNQVVTRILNDYNVYKGNVKSNDIENMLNNLDNDKLLNKITERYDEKFLNI